MSVWVAFAIGLAAGSCLSTAALSLVWAARRSDDRAERLALEAGNYRLRIKAQEQARPRPIRERISVPPIPGYGMEAIGEGLE